LLNYFSLDKIDEIKSILQTNSKLLEELGLKKT